MPIHTKLPCSQTNTIGSTAVASFTLTSVHISFPLLPCIGTEQPHCDDAGSEERKRQSWIEIHSVQHRSYTIQLALLLKKYLWPHPVNISASRHPLPLFSSHYLWTFRLSNWLDILCQDAHWEVGLEESWHTLALRKNPPSEPLTMV